jgi:hypothetical protein
MTGLGLSFGSLVTSLAPGATFSWQDSSSAIPNAMLRHPGVSLARDVYSSAYISTWTGSGQIFNDGMILNPTNLSIEDSPISGGYKMIKGARTTDGDYQVNVVDFDFTNGISNVDIKTYWRVDTDCTIKIFYNSIAGANKLGKTAIFTNGAAAPNYQSVNFSVSDAKFTGSNDIVITITGASPLFNYVNVFRDVTSVPIFLPAIAAQPVSRTNNAGTLATFTVTATGTSPLSYQWHKESFPLSNGGNVSGATGAMLSLSNVSQSDAASYSVVISNKGGTATSVAATLTVIDPPPPQLTSISLAGANALVLQGAGGPAYGGAYYWLRCTTNLSSPLTNWSVMTTNAFDLNGNFSNQIPVTPGTPQMFYRLELP